MEKVHVIHRSKRIDRYKNVVEQFEKQNAKFILCSGVEPIIGMPVYTAISKAHKKIVQRAKDWGMERVVIAEDDINFLGEGCLRYFLDNVPDEFDIYTGSAFQIQYEGEKVIGFEGLTLYMVNEKFYETFLSLPEDEQLDVVLSGKGNYKLSPKIVAGQIRSFSDNKKVMAEPEFQTNYPLFS